MPVLIDRYRPTVRIAGRYRSISTGISITFLYKYEKVKSAGNFLSTTLMTTMDLTMTPALCEKKRKKKRFFSFVFIFKNSEKSYACSAGVRDVRSVWPVVQRLFGRKNRNNISWQFTLGTRILGPEVPGTKFLGTDRSDTKVSMYYM